MPVTPGNRRVRAGLYDARAPAARRSGPRQRRQRRRHLGGPAAPGAAVRARRSRTGAASRPGRTSSRSTTRTRRSGSSSSSTPGAHLVGHSYGGVIALLAAARRPELLRSLTVVEPPALRVARGKPARWTRSPRERGAVGARPARSRGVPARLPRRGRRAAPTARSPRSPPGRANADGRALSVDGRDPARRARRRRRSRSSSSPGRTARRSTRSATCSKLRLDAERAVLPGAGHAVQRLGEPFNDVLADFVERAKSRKRESAYARLRSGSPSARRRW